jgi:hypothetical protein
MGKVHDGIDGRLREFIERQHLFFVATAPLSGDGHINLSPRGIPGTACVVEEHTFAWLDLTGSGSETVAHLRENGRITVMFCAFDGAPNIMRLHGQGRVVTVYDDEYAAWADRFDTLPGARAVIVVDVERVSDSCGWGVPLMDHVGERDLLQQYFGRRGFDGSADYRRRKNRTSLDGLPAFDFDPLDEWSTPVGLAAIRDRYAALTDGWQAPVAWGVAVDGTFTHVNRPGGSHGLSAVTLGYTLKHDGSTATLPLSRTELADAVELLAPAEACAELEHPNLAAWRAALADGAELEAVFVRSLDDEVSSAADAALRALLG